MLSCNQMWSCNQLQLY